MTDSTLAKTYLQLRTGQLNSGSIISRKNLSDQQFHATAKNEKKAQTIAIASGKGGVGKTTIGVHLALELAQKGSKVLLVDGDLGMANVHLLLGRSVANGLYYFLKDPVSFKDHILPYNKNLDFISSAGDSHFFNQLSSVQLMHLSYAIDRTKKDYDYILIDCPAGMGSFVRYWISLCSKILLVTNPQPSALLDAYSLIKVCYAQHYPCTKHIIINNVRSKQEGQRTFDHLKKCTLKFLNQRLYYKGSLYKDLKIEKALYQKTPLGQLFTNTPFLRGIKEISGKINS